MEHVRLCVARGGPGAGVSLSQTMRAGERTLDGEGGARQGGKARSDQSFNNTIEYGWVFPHSKTRRKGLIDSAWLCDFNRYIEALQKEIKRQRARVYDNDKTSYQEEVLSGDCRNEIESLKSEDRRQMALVQGEKGMLHNADALRADYHRAKRCVPMECNASECCASDAEKCKDKHCVPEMITSPRVPPVSSSEEACALDSSAVVACSSKEANSREGYAKMSGCDQGLEMELGTETHLSDEGESSWSEKSFVMNSRLRTYAAGAAKCDEYTSGYYKGKMQESPDAEKSAGCENSFMLHPSLNTHAEGAAAKCDEYSSMQSDVSKDSGIFSTYDTSFFSEVCADRTLLQELGDVLSDQDVSLETCIHCGSLPLDKVEPGNKGHDGCTVWLTRLSSSNDISRWGSYEWGRREAGEHSHESCCSFDSSLPVVSNRKHCFSEDYDDQVTPLDVAVHEQEKVVQKQRCSACVKLCEGVKVKSCFACEELNKNVEARSLIPKDREREAQRKNNSLCENGRMNAKVKECATHDKLKHESPVSSMQEVSEVAKLSKRVDDLRSGLNRLVAEVKESKLEFLDLEERAKQLLASTVLSQHRLKQVGILQLLEDRLQDEWWAAYDPNSAPFHENYIV